jgi:hypothetical protein
MSNHLPTNYELCYVQRYSKRLQSGSGATGGAGGSNSPLYYFFNVAPFYQQQAHQSTAQHHEFRWVEKRVDLRYQNPVSFPWNYLDQLVCGYYTDFMDSIKYWRMAFLLLPASNVAGGVDVTMAAGGVGGSGTLSAPSTPVALRSQSSVALLKSVNLNSSSNTVSDDAERIHNFAKFKSSVFQGTKAKGMSMDVTLPVSIECMPVIIHAYAA